jgi:hypothetical protein
MTMELADDAPQHNLPWIITLGPFEEDEDWDPVVCGPYERAHALALAQALIADSDLIAVVEPVLPATSLDEIRAEVAKSQLNATESAAARQDDLDSDDEFEEDEFDDEYDEEHTHDDDDDYGEAPSPQEIRAGFRRISARLTQA